MSNYERKKNSCDFCIKIFKFIPVIFIFAVIVWSYYAYVIQLSFLYVTNIFQKVFYLIFYHVILTMFMWSYYQTIFTDFGKVPQKFRLPQSELENFFRASCEEEQKRVLENFARDLPVVNRTITGAIRYCDKCAHVKPDRAHHCSVCGCCVLKMDHHCPWVNNCVNYTNYKYFILFLGYSLVYCLYVALTTMPFFVQFWRGELDGGTGRFHILFLTLVAAMFAVSLVSLFGYHIYLVLLNRTTLEAFRAPIFRFGGPDKNGFSLGSYNNFQEVFGDDKLYWFLPIFTSLGDGVQYPVQAQHSLQSYESMGVTQPSLDNNSVVIPINVDANVERLLDNSKVHSADNGHNSFDASHIVLTNVEVGNNGIKANETSLNV